MSPEITDAPGEVDSEEARDAYVRSADSAPGSVMAALARADQATRSRVVNRLQRERGNAYVQRLVERSVPHDSHPAAVQRDGEDEPSGSGYRLRSPSLLGGAGAGPGPSSANSLHLDPEIQAQIRAIEITRNLLDPTALRTALLGIELTTPSTSPNPFAAPSLPTPGPLVPRGAGPETSRSAEAGDFLGGLMAVPAIDTAVTRLQTLALDQVRSDYRRLSTGERIAAITAGVLIGGAALAGVGSSPEARRLALDQLNGRVIPVPGLSGLSVELNTQRGGVMVGLHLDIGALLPPALGFGPGSPTPIGGPP